MAGRGGVLPFPSLALPLCYCCMDHCFILCAAAAARVVGCFHVSLLTPSALRFFSVRTWNGFSLFFESDISPGLCTNTWKRKEKEKNVIVGIAKAEAHTQITISLFLCTVSVWIVKSATPSTTERVLANLALIPNRLRRIDKAFLSPERWNLFKESGKVTIPSTVTAGPRWDAACLTN